MGKQFGESREVASHQPHKLGITGASPVSRTQRRGEKMDESQCNSDQSNSSDDGESEPPPSKPLHNTNAARARYRITLLRFPPFIQFGVRSAGPSVCISATACCMPGKPLVLCY